MKRLICLFRGHVRQLDAENERLRGAMECRDATIKGQVVAMRQAADEIERKAELLEVARLNIVDRDKENERLRAALEPAKAVLRRATPLDDPDPNWCMAPIDDLEALEEAIEALQDKDQ